MKYFAVVSLNVKDDSWIESYLPNVTELVNKHGGNYISRTQTFERIEGEGADPDIYVLIEWPSKEAALAFYQDPDYQPYLQSRLAGADSNFFLVAGEDIAAG
ncbi:MAG: DUF1330 domain-containing protein [Alphaproteobacteria bacterium]|jgi:uncharacterized protein (DUF1330 family)|nr:DUF1330 domain-containing protein [Alphaproteobacteria bacterium]MDP6565696.1 DUF1330 domain-containing protein [Alphaproteobacteria bacterium]MDP6815798.1 DUF1330 domain-containing protein [Alphaproteobacteria bacterium]|tara:strand:- start:215 stop:520 length:306 start_codon:yes stop_codon:yes gene_type:complete